MTDSGTTPSAFTPTWAKQSRQGLIAFAVAVVLVVGAAALILQYGWIIKRPVPWPEGVEVNGDYRMLSMPDSFGDYRAIYPGDPLYEAYNSGKNAEFVEGSDIVVSETNLGDLDMPSGYDDVRYQDRSGNWYVQRIYMDTRPNREYKYWQLNIYYYTGMKDTVAHVPEVCITAGGGEVNERSSYTFEVPDATTPADSPWNDPVTFLRTQYSLRQLNSVNETEAVAYFIFALNGNPVNADNTTMARSVVRRKMNFQFEHYNYFAKIQFAPVQVNVRNQKDADEASTEFIKAALPAILPLLPSAEAVKVLEQSAD
jgi:hypothetical protein